MIQLFGQYSYQKIFDIIYPKDPNWRQGLSAKRASSTFLDIFDDDAKKTEVHVYCTAGIAFFVSVILSILIPKRWKCSEWR